MQRTSPFSSVIRTSVCPQFKPARILQRSAVYHVDRSSPQNSSYEQTQVNRILEPGKGQYFQHPHISRGTCIMEDCINKLCITPCSKIIAQAHVVVATHNDKFPNTNRLSSHDLQGEEKPQHGIAHTPIENYDTQGHNKDEKMTERLNNDSEMLNNVHNLSSKERTIPLGLGSDEIPIIN